MWGDPSKPAALTLVLLSAWLLLYLPRGQQQQQQAAGGRQRTPGLLNCSSLGQLSRLEWLASGWTKAVYRGRLQGGSSDIAVKTVNLDGHDIESCLSRPEAPTLTRCYRRTSAKLLRELVLLQQLQHPNVIKVLGSCIPDSLGPVLIATELGEPLDSVALLQLSWEERLKVALSVASLLHYLAHSPLGSLAAHDLKRQQFVLVGGILKLADVDDLGVGEPRCDTHTDCFSHSGLSEEDGIFCVSGRCRGHNERSNILRAGEDLVRHVLPGVGPEGLQTHVKNILAAYRGDNRWDSARILLETEVLVEKSR